MPAFSGQQTTQLQLRGSGSATVATPVLRTPSEYEPAAPSSGNSVPSDLPLPLRNPAPRSVTRSSSSSTTVSAGSRTSAGLLSPRTKRQVQRVFDADQPQYLLPLTHEHGTPEADEPSLNNTAKRSVMRAAESGRGHLLPVRSTSTKLTVSPTYGSRMPARHVPGRSKSHCPTSTTVLPRTRQDVDNTNTNKGSSSSGSKQSKLAHLRRRTANNSSDDEDPLKESGTRRSYDAESTNGNTSDSFYFGRLSAGRRKRQGSGTASLGGTSTGTNNNEYSTSREHPGPKHQWGSGVVCQQQLIKISRMKLGHLLQMMIVLAVISLVYESHHKALFATHQLTQFKEEESLLLLHLQKIEQQSIQLHENLGRLAQAHLEGNMVVGRKLDNGNSEDDEKHGSDDREVDFDLIHKQTQQLYQMEEELSHEVQTLQKRIQLSARNHIIQEFGEGPVMVVLELDLGDFDHRSSTGSSDANSKATAKTRSPDKISILLWHDTPHAAWTWLEQIGNHVWDGAPFHWDQGGVIDAIPSDEAVLANQKKRSSGNGKIEFVEQSQHSHQAWTVGVREHPIHNSNNEPGRSSLGIYINLQDNTDLHKHETCVGKIIDGFDVLQKLLEAARNNGNESGEQRPHQTKGKHNNGQSSLVIRKATAMHYVTKKPGMGY
ncbi:unnamed protein product [Pseudo-nitzschia multistriata]|uniref:PPIase cyclophilin-type domain-containing protein n=1 Tax=Pseudo-nitzschia multistriata TaxID=183589 RepID=A0A448ZAH4_9STRA|nr:unnamed protein product [Pseudo-nitzschia multistriata]